MFGFLFFCSTVIAVAVSQVPKPLTPEDEKCLRDAYENQIQLFASEPNLMDWAGSYYAFYTLFWSKPMTSDQMKRFCDNYVRGIKAYDNCSDSNAKEYQLKYQLGFVTYLCKQRPNDYIPNMDCLKNAAPDAQAACANQCTKFENGSNTFNNPPSNTQNVDMKAALADNCQYLNCTAQCQKPIFAKKCTPAAANLQLDSLYVLEAASPEYHQSKLFGISDELFPPPCRKLAEAGSNLIDSSNQTVQDTETAPTSQPQPSPQQPGPSTQEDRDCLKDAYETHYRAMVSDPDIWEYGVAHFAPRQFYSLFWSKPMTSDQTEKFCQNYVRGVKAYANCSDTFEKRVQLNMLSFTSYLCKQRPDDYIPNMTCLKNALPDANATCANQCTKFENGSDTFNNPPDNVQNIDMKAALADDCQFLNCTAQCQKPIFAQKCNATAANLQLDSLYALEVVMNNLMEPPPQTELVIRLPPDQLFPPQCRKLADAGRKQWMLEEWNNGAGNVSKNETVQTDEESQKTQTTGAPVPKPAGPATEADKKCLQDAFETHYRAMVSDVSLSEYGATHFSPRQFYSLFWSKPMTSDQMEKFCQNYVRGVKAYANCSDTFDKRIQLNVLSFTSYFCKQRPYDYIPNMTCLKNALPDANATCANQCTIFENGSDTFNNPSSNFQDIDMMKAALADDCQFLNCTAQCQKTVFAQKCNATAANLQLDSLYALEVVMNNMMEPPPQTELLIKLPPDQYFPPQCRKLADAGRKQWTLQEWNNGAGNVSKNETVQTDEKAKKTQTTGAPTPKPAGPATEEDKKCLQNAFETHYRTMVSDVSLSEYGATHYAARQFYTLFWSKPMTTDQMKKFCHNYVQGVKAYDTCSDTDEKEIQLTQLSFADYFCKQRPRDYIPNMTCLKNALPDAQAACKNRCTKFENGSNTFNNPPSDIQGVDMKAALADDCQFLNCTAQCQKPIFVKKCNADAANLQLDSLYALESTFRRMFEPPQYREQLELLRAMTHDENLQPFPKECRQLADAAKNSTAFVADAVSPQPPPATPLPHDVDCLHDAFGTLFQAIQSDPELKLYRLVTFRPRYFYAEFWSNPMTSDQLKNFCEIFVRGIKGYDKCPNSTAKENIMNLLSFPSYICQHDYIPNMTCLKNALPEAQAACANRCKEFENASKIFDNLMPDDADQEHFPLTVDTKTELAADCQLLNCTAQCQKPIFLKKCGIAAANLQLDSIYILETTTKNIFEQQQYREQLKHPNPGESFHPFPPQCQQLADAARNLTNA